MKKLAFLTLLIVCICCLLSFTSAASDETDEQAPECCIIPNKSGGIINYDGKTYFSCSFRSYPSDFALTLFNEYICGMFELRVYIADDINNKTYCITDYFEINNINDIMIPVGDYEIPLDANGKYSVKIEFVEANVEDGPVYGSAISDKGVFHSTDDDFLENGVAGSRHLYAYVTEGVFDAEYITELKVYGVFQNNSYRDENGEYQTLFEIQITTITRNRVIPESLVDTELVWTLNFSGNDGSVNTVNIKPERQLMNLSTFFRPGHQTVENRFVPTPGVSYTVEISVTDKNGVTWTGKSDEYIVQCPLDFVPALPSEPVEKDGFIEEDGSLYYYENDERVTGWFTYNGLNYYASRVTGVVINYDKTIGGKFYVWNDATGLTLASGFVDDGIGIKCYYEGYNVIGWHHADGSGPKVENGIFEQYSQNPEGLYYFLSTTGYMVTDSTYKLGGYMREFNEDHTVKPLNGLQDYYGTYYYYVNGVKQTGWQTIDGVTYYFMASDHVFGQAAQRWMYIGNKVYYFYASTSATPYALKTSGSIGGIDYEYHEDWYIIYNGFINCEYANVAPDNSAANIQKKNSTTRYYVNGEMQTDWQNIDGNWYYFFKIGSENGSGYMCTESRTIGGVWYEFEEDGKCPGYGCAHLDVTIIKGYNATCTAPGLTDGKACSACGEVLEAQEAIDVLGHTEGEWVTDKEATKAEDGLKYQSCSVCGEKLKEEVIYATGSLGLAYNENGDGTCTITGIGECEDKEIIIPSYLNGNKVTAIGKKAFYNQKNITNVIMGDSVTLIDAQAFQNCSALVSITLSKNLTNVGGSSGADVFGGSKVLKNVYFRGTIEDWCKIAFKSAKANPMNLASNFYILGQNGEYSLVTSITIPESVTVIGSWQFYGFDNLTTVVMSDTVETVSQYAFMDCTKLANVTLSSNLKNIYLGGFYNCGMTDISLPESLVTLGNKAFQQCTKLVSVVIPDGIKTIPEYAFYGCSSLTTVVIPESVTAINNYAFNTCTKLANVYYKGTEEQWANITITANQTLVALTVTYDYKY